jgi:hypothetical protein
MSEERQPLEKKVEDLEQQVADIQNSAQRRFYSIRTRSKRSVFGLPLYDIAIGPDLQSGEVFGRARGFIAVGDFAVGVVALARIAIGCFTFGGISIGILLAFGGLSVGSVALGGAALGIVAIGGAVAGFIGIGGAALGYYGSGGAVYSVHRLVL